VNTKSGWIVGSALTLAGLLVTYRTPNVEAAKSPYPQPCTVTFLDRGVTYQPVSTTGDRIYSDNVSQQYIDGALTGGDKTVSCQVGGVNSDSVKLLLSSPAKPTTTRRWFWGDYTLPVFSGEPTDTFTDGSYLIIEHIATMGVGTSQAGSSIGAAWGAEHARTIRDRTPCG
jgi:hypothetical protein